MKNIIKEALNKNPIGVKEAIEEELRARISIALQELSNKKLNDYEHKAVNAWMEKPFTEKGDKRIDGAMLANAKRLGGAKVRGTPVKEETEDLDEVSKATLGSYINKALPNAVSSKFKFIKATKDSFDNPNAESEVYRQMRKYDNRVAGVKKATDRLVKENEDLEEHSIGTKVRVKGSRSSMDGHEGVVSWKNAAGTHAEVDLNGGTYSFHVKHLEKINEDLEEGKGLWANIHARRKKGLRPKRPGEDGYPKTLKIEETEIEEAVKGDGSKRNKVLFTAGLISKDEYDKRMGHGKYRKSEPAGVGPLGKSLYKNLVKKLGEETDLNEAETMSWYDADKLADKHVTTAVKHKKAGNLAGTKCIRMF